jgi:hypothetical protein
MYEEEAMGREQPQPSDELIEKVKLVTAIKSCVRGKHQKKFGQFGLLVMRRKRRIAKGTVYSYWVSGRVFTYLRFTDAWDERVKYGITVKKYKPGDWEKRLDKLYEFAEAFRLEHRDDPDIFTSNTIP